MDELRTDLRFSLRMMARNPGLTTAAILAMGLGIGANAAIFSVVDGVLLRPLAYREPDRLVAVWENNRARGRERNEVSPGNYLDWEAQSRSFAGLGAYADTGANLSGGAPERVQGVAATAGTLALLGIPPQLGRLFTAEEANGRRPLVVLSNSLWRRRFGADRGVVGKTMVINGRAREIIGVMPPGFRFPAGRDQALWVPLALHGEHGEAAERDSRYLRVVGRLRRGVTLGAARAELAAFARRLEERYPAADRGWSSTVQPLREDLVGTVRPALAILLATTFMVLAIACSNVANLLLARATVRQREAALRAVLGAGRWRLVRQYLTESTALALAGGLAGLVLAGIGVRLLRLALDPAMMPRIADVGIDGRLLAFTLGVSLATGIAFGLAPALKASRIDIAAQLEQGGRASSHGPRGNRLRGLLVIGQTALALVLLAGAGLMVRSLLGLWRVDPGFEPRGVIAMDLFVTPAKYPTPRALDAFHARLLQRLRTIPAVESAAAVTNLPLDGSDMTMVFSLPGQAPATGSDRPEASYRCVTPDYFRTIGATVVAGRTFGALDHGAARRVAAINLALARKYWPGRVPIGATMVSDGVSYEIVGIVGDLRDRGLDAPAKPEIFLPMAQEVHYSSHLLVRVRAAGEPGPIFAALRGALREVDPDLPVSGLRSLEEVRSRSLAPTSLCARLLAAFAALALVLAVLGIYSVNACVVSERSREIGIRMALGARRGEICRSVLGRGLLLAGAGTVLGLALALVATRGLAALLYAVSPSDPLTLAAIAALLLAAATAGAYLPARRAMRIDPALTLREAP